MKKVLIVLFTLFTTTTFAAQVPFFVFPDVLEYAIKKNFSVMDYAAVTQEWEKRMTADGTVTATDIEAVCKVGRLDKTACTKFRDDIMTYFYPVCEKAASKGKSDCINDFWAMVHGTWVRPSEAIGIAQEYAHLKNNETVVCSPSARNVNPPARASYIKCTSVNGEHFYEFKFNSTTETKDRDIISGTLRAVGTMHNIDFKNSDCSLERIYADSSCALSYKTDDKNQCDKISKSLQRFGYHSQIVTTEKFGKRCEVFGLSGGNRSAYNIDNTVFQDVQYVAGPEIERRIKDYVKKELGRQGITLTSFKCDASTKHNYGYSSKTGLPNSHTETLTCYVNDSAIDFVFKDLSEDGKRAKESGLAKMACAQIGGKIDGKDCRGLDENECHKVNYKIPGGTSWDSKAEVCVLNKPEMEKKINDRIQIMGGLVLAIGVGALVAAEAGLSATGEIVYILAAGTGSVIIDQGAIQIDDLERLKPAKYAHEFVTDAMACEIPSGITQCNRTEVSCASGVVSKHFHRLNEIIDKLNNEQLNTVVEAMVNVTDCLNDEQFQTALKTLTTTDIKDKVTNQAGMLWLILGVFVSPENTVTKLATRAPKIAKVLNRCRVADRISGSLNGAQYVRIYTGNLNKDEITRLAQGFKNRKLHVSSNMTEDGRRFLGVADMDVFGNWRYDSYNWLTTDEIIAKYHGEFRQNGLSRTIHGDYYRFYVNPNTDNSQLLKELTDHGFYISSNSTEDQYFIAASRENVFSPWENDANNWLKYGIKSTTTSLSQRLKNATGFNFEFKLGSESGLHVNHYRIDVSGKSEYEIQTIKNQLTNAGFGNQIEVLDTNKGKLLVVYEDNIPVKKANDIFNKIYDDIPTDELQKKLDYVYNHSDTQEHAIYALEQVGGFDRTRATEMANDIADIIVERFRQNPTLAEQARRWRSLQQHEREALMLDIHYTIAHTRRPRIGNTIVGFDPILDDGRVVGGFHRNGSTFRPREFQYNPNEPTIESVFSMIIHENTHAFQSVYKSSIPQPLLELANRFYTNEGDLYYHTLEELEAYFVGDTATSRIVQLLGL